MRSTPSATEVTPSFSRVMPTPCNDARRAAMGLVSSMAPVLAVSHGQEVLPRERGDLEQFGVVARDPAQLFDLGADHRTLIADVGFEDVGDDEESRFVRGCRGELAQRAQVA